MTHYPPHIKPMPCETVLLIHYTARGDYICETGFVNDHGEWLWHNPNHNAEGDEPLDVHEWRPLPLIPARGDAP